MADRYSRLFHSDEAVYFESSPVIIEAKALLCDNEADKNIAQIKFKNISPKTVTAVFADITAYDPSGEAVEKISHTYLDLSAGRGDSFGAKNPAGLSGKTARSFDVIVCKAVFADGSVWENNGCERVVIPEQKDLTEYLGNASLSEQYQKRHGSFAKYVPQKISGIWLCACGKINHSDEGECFSCKQSLAALTESLDTEGLTAGLYDHAKGLMAKAVSEGDFKEAEGKFTSIKAYLDCADLAAECREKAEYARKDKMYASAVKLMENNTVKSLEEAADSFKRISDWKDSAEKINQCKNKLDEIKNKQASVMAEQMKAEKKKRTVIAAICGAAALCVVFAVVNANVLVPASNYKKAAALMDSGSYDEAAQMFEELGDYKDSYDLSLSARYNQGEALMNEGFFDEAIEIFESLNNYNNSHENVRLATFNKGLSLMESEQYEEAAELFVKVIDMIDESELENNEESRELKHLAEHNNALALIKSGSSWAKYAIKSYDVYNESKDLRLEIMYQYVLNTEKENTDEDRYNFLLELKKENYADSVEILANQYKITVEVKDKFEYNYRKELDYAALKMKVNGLPKDEQLPVRFQFEFEYENSKKKWSSNQSISADGDWDNIYLPEIRGKGFDLVGTWRLDPALLPLTVTYTYTDLTGTGNEVTGTFTLQKE